MKDWLKRWDENRIGFHQSNINPYLQKYFDVFSSSENNIFVPLCGKSLDMIWLSSKAKKIIGVEIAHKAIDGFMKENNLVANMEQKEKLTLYKINNIDFFVGDFFDLKEELPTQIDIFDSASLVAFNKQAREKYSKRIIQILNNKMLLITLEYSEKEKQGPPFNVSEDEVYKLYGNDCNIKLLETLNLKDTKDRLNTLSYAYEKIYLIEKK